MQWRIETVRDERMPNRVLPLWPPRVVDRDINLNYPWVPAHQFLCVCGEYVWNMDSIMLTRNINEPFNYPSARFVHGENSECVIVVEDATVLSVRLERELAEWTYAVHEYERTANRPVWQ